MGSFGESDLALQDRARSLWDWIAQGRLPCSTRCRETWTRQSPPSASTWRRRTSHVRMFVLTKQANRYLTSREFVEDCSSQESVLK